MFFEYFITEQHNNIMVITAHLHSYQEVNRTRNQTTIWSGSFLLGLVFMTRLNCRATATNDTNYNCHIQAIELVQSIIWIHITPHHTTSYYQSWGWTHRHTHMHTLWTRSVSRNQVHTGLWPACTWFISQDTNLCKKSLTERYSIIIALLRLLKKLKI